MNPSQTAIPRAVLDSNVIFSRVLHEFLGRLALEARLLDIVYSDELLAETKRVLMRDKPVGEPIAERWISYLRDAFPNGATSITNMPADVDLASLTSDPDDEHVCALAIAAEANLLITFDSRGLAISSRRPTPACRRLLDLPTLLGASCGGAWPSRCGSSRPLLTSPSRYAES